MSRRAAGLGVVALVALLIAFIVMPPWPIVLLDANTLAYAVCHRIPSHSFSIAGHQLPLCARCTGIYLSALATLAALATVRPKARTFPGGPVLGLFLLFIAVMGVDGLNSLLTLIPGAPSAYEPRNWLRLLTGAFDGVAMGGILFPLFNMTVWCDGRDVPAVTGRILAGLALLALAISAVVLSEAPWLLWPLAVLSGLGVLTLVGLLNVALVVIATRREGSFRTLAELAPFVVYGLLLTFVELGAINLLRHWLESSLGVVVG
ncbi:MAG: DUF2085 domain-containing protein [Ardenticatenaceae bacterium]|nr:DUF2085 domain-containing protein [Ardenticatenaceae bacterium]HBY95278.1 hypothetical protein [Chloroflexota bacterium]